MGLMQTSELNGFATAGVACCKAGHDCSDVHSGRAAISQAPAMAASETSPGLVDCATRPTQRPYYADAPDELLLSASRCGDTDAFGELCRRHSRPLQIRIRSIVKHREDAEDVYQETLLSAYKHINTFRGACKFQTWITRIGINCSLVLLRNRGRRSKLVVDPLTIEDAELDPRILQDPSPNPEQIVAKQQSHQLIAQSLIQLRADHRYILEQRYQEECSLSDVADNLGISESALKARLLRARRLLRTSVEALTSPSKETEKTRVAGAAMKGFAVMPRVSAA